MERYRLRFNNSLAALIMLAILLVTGLLGYHLKQTMSEEVTITGYSKYYTSVRLEEGDTLYSLAERYNNLNIKSADEYVRELRSMNCLTEDLIHAGNYLTITYYKTDVAASYNTY